MCVGVHAYKQKKAYVLLTRCTYINGICLMCISTTFELTDMCESLLVWHMLLERLAVGNKVWEGWQSIRWKSSKRFRTPQWMWGYLCFTSRCSLILSILPYTSRGSACILVLCLQVCFRISLLALPHSHHVFSHWHRGNKTANTNTALRTIHLHKCTHLFVSRFL